MRSMSDVEPITAVFEARLEPSTQGRHQVIVDSSFAATLRTEHERTFVASAFETGAGEEQLTRDLPNVGEDDLAALDDRGLVQVGTEVRPGMILIGKVTPREGAAPTNEEKLLRAIFGEALGPMRETSLRVPPGCFGVVAMAQQVEPDDDDGERARAEVTVSWERPLETGDVLLLAGEAVVVAGIEPLTADIAWSGDDGTVPVAKAAMARDVLHARSIGPYTPLTQQPARGREAFGGQPLDPGIAQTLATHAPWALWELLTVKSDAVSARARAYESLVRQNNPDVVPRPTPAPASGKGKDIFSFFAPASSAGPSDVLALQPETVSTLVAYLRALGLELGFDEAEVGVTLRSAAQIREDSHGEVKLPETVQAGTGKAVPGGLVCERIFGPVADYECSCGKYSRMKHRGVVCEECGVEVINSSVRRKRFGHITLTVPCLHPLLVDAVATLLGLNEEELREVVAGTRVLRADGDAWSTEPGEGTLGGRELWNALEALDLEAIDATEVGPRAELAEALADTERPATALMLEVVPVLPPELRPPGEQELGLDAAGITDGVRRLLNRNNRIRRLLELEAPAVILRNEATMLQRAVDELMVEGRRKKTLDGEDGPLLPSLLQFVDALWTDRLVAKTVDYSGVAHLYVDDSLEPDQCRVPSAMLMELFKPWAYGMLEAKGYTTTIKSAKRMVESGRPEGRMAIEAAAEGYPVLLTAGSTVLGRRVVIGDGAAIAVDRATAQRLGHHRVALHVPLMDQAALQCAELDDDASGASPPSDAGWLHRARQEGNLGRNAVAAALGRERDEVWDSLVALAVGRVPQELDEQELESWAQRMSARRDEAWARRDDRRAAEQEQEQPARNPHWDRSLGELEFTVKVARVLDTMGLTTIGQLCGRTEAELLKTRGIGRRELMEIKELLVSLDLGLGMRDA